MAKREECHFDTDGFIEDFRKEAVPSYHSAKSDVTTAPPAIDKPPKRKKVEPVPDATEFLWVDPDEIDAIRKYQDLNMTEDEIGYIKEFIVNSRFRRVSHKGKQVTIRELHHKRIKSILELLGEDAANISTYIDNVLTEHFKKHYSTIMGIAKKCPSKF